MNYRKARMAEIWHRLMRILKHADENRQVKKAQAGLPRETYERYLTLNGRNGKPIMEEI